MKDRGENMKQKNEKRNECKLILKQNDCSTKRWTLQRDSSKVLCLRTLWWSNAFEVLSESKKGMNLKITSL